MNKSNLYLRYRDRFYQTDKQTVSFITFDQIDIVCSQNLTIQIEDRDTATKTNSCRYRGSHFLKSI